MNLTPPLKAGPATGTGTHCLPFTSLHPFAPRPSSPPKKCSVTTRTSILWLQTLYHDIMTSLTSACGLLHKPQTDSPGFSNTMLALCLTCTHKGAATQGQPAVAAIIISATERNPCLDERLQSSVVRALFKTQFQSVENSGGEIAGLVAWESVALFRTTTPRMQCRMRPRKPHVSRIQIKVKMEQ